MKGLLTKDIRLITSRKQTFLIFIVIMLIMGASMDAVFLSGYGTMLLGIFAIGTLSYDDFDNCMPFLLTLPITKKDYVKEKYLFVEAAVVIGWICSIIISCGIAIIRGQMSPLISEPAELYSQLPLFMAIFGAMLPIEIKFGTERSRTILVVLAGLVFAVGMLFGKMMKGAPTFAQKLDQVSGPVMAVTFTIVGLAIMAAGYAWSLRIMKEKEY